MLPYLDLSPEEVAALPPAEGRGYSIPVDGELLSVSIVQQFYTTDGIRKILALADAIETDINSALLPGLRPQLAFNLIHFGILCAEKVDYTLADVQLDAASPVVQGYVAIDTQQYYSVCQTLDVPLLPDVSKEPVESDIPTLVLTGALDPATPIEMLDKLLPTLDTVYSYIFAGGIHVRLFQNDDCSAELGTQFIHDPNTAPTTNCIEKQALSFESEMP